jgi:hypothetical protein
MSNALWEGIPLAALLQRCDGYLGYLFEKLVSFLVEACKMRV